MEEYANFTDDQSVQHDNMNISNYLNRINYQGPIAPTLEVLAQLQKQHLLNVPFENLDIHEGKLIELNVQKIYHKIVLNRRGGFCYELNVLFYELLRQIGFQAKIISGRVYDQEKGYGPPYDHLALLVKIEENVYLVDVGFGEFVFHPLVLTLDRIQRDVRGQYFIDRYDDNYLRVNKVKDGLNIPQYLFMSKERAYQEFAPMCHYHQTSPLTHFTKERFLGIPTENGRISIVGNTLKISQGIHEETRTIEDGELETLLKQYFNFGS